MTTPKGGSDGERHTQFRRGRNPFTLSLVRVNRCEFTLLPVESQTRDPETSRTTQLRSEGVEDPDGNPVEVREELSEHGPKGERTGLWFKETRERI